jgi:menaquinone-9 beta-reductase
MATDLSFDVVIAGGGLAGATLGGVLARAGLGVLVVEKEAAFRDRVRGEVAWPWGYSEALRAGLGPLFDEVGPIALPTIEVYQDRQRVDQMDWAAASIDALPAVSFSHPHLQESALGWAQSQGATVARPAKVTLVQPDAATASVAVVQDGRVCEYNARLVVGADGKQSALRGWNGGESLVDAEHHRFGGLAVSGANWDTDALGWAPTPGAAVSWFPRGDGSYRVYIRTNAERVAETGVGRSVEAFVGFAGGFMPEGMLADAVPAGPLGFFSNSCTWPSRVADGPVVLVGDAAGALDPSQGLGTSLVFRDVRGLSELLLTDKGWGAATTEFADRRQAYYAVLRAYDRWCAVLEAEEGDEADRRRERHAAGREADPSLGGLGTLEARGPDGLIPDETARPIYFGEPTNRRSREGVR